MFGRSGRVGWELQRALAPLGDLLALDRNTPGPLAADFSQPEAVAATVRAVAPQVIVNASACTAVDEAESESELAHAINAAAPACLAREAAALGAWLLHYSTDHVFDGNGSAAWNEDSPTGPINVYGQSKLRGEQAIRVSGCKHLILRTSWVYAVRRTNFARTMLQLAAQRERIEVVDDQIGAPTGAELLADVSAHALRGVLAQPRLGGTYHAAAAGETSRHGYARYVIEFARGQGQAIRVRPENIVAVPSSALSTPARRPSNSRMDTRKLQLSFGLTLPDWRVGVERMLRELLDRSAEPMGVSTCERRGCGPAPPYPAMVE